MPAPWPQTIGRALRFLLLPGACLACHRFLSLDEDGFCTDCETVFHVETEPVCPRCSASLGSEAARPDGCSHCEHEKWSFSRVIRVGAYQGSLRELILRMKWPSGELLAHAVADRWAEIVSPKLSGQSYDAALPVPLHWRRRMQRGFNVAEILARAVAHRLGIRLWADGLQRTRATLPQSELSPSERRANVRGAFALKRRCDVRGAALLLVDDVLTTGSTADEASRPLLAAGAREIGVAVIAHGH